MLEEHRARLPTVVPPLRLSRPVGASGVLIEAVGGRQAGDLLPLPQAVELLGTAPAYW